MMEYILIYLVLPQKVYIYFNYFLAFHAFFDRIAGEVTGKRGERRGRHAANTAKD